MMGHFLQPNCYDEFISKRVHISTAGDLLLTKNGNAVLQHKSVLEQTLNHPCSDLLDENQ
jgi:hypothetical protein